MAGIRLIAAICLVDALAIGGRRRAVIFIGSGLRSGLSADAAFSRGRVPAHEGCYARVQILPKPKRLPVLNEFSRLRGWIYEQRRDERALTCAVRGAPSRSGKASE